MSTELVTPTWRARHATGIAKARAEGKYSAERMGKAKARTQDALELHAAGMTPDAIIEKLAISRASLFRILAKARAAKAR